MKTSVTVVKRIGIDGKSTSTHSLSHRPHTLCLYLSPKGSDGLRIKTTKKVKSKGKTLLYRVPLIAPPSTEVVVLEAFLCRLGRVDRVQSGFTSLPLLLSRGPQALSSQLRLWLETSFDCHVSPHSLEAEDLSLLTGQFATAERSK